MVLDGIYETEKRDEVAALLEWPDVQAERDIEESDRQTRATLASMGIALYGGEPT